MHHCNKINLILGISLFFFACSSNGVPCFLSDKVRLKLSKICLEYQWILMRNWTIVVPIDYHLVEGI